MSWIVGVICSLIIAGVAYAKKSLTGSGFLAAVVVGTLLYALGTVAWFSILIFFFISSSLLSRLRSPEKREAEKYYEKTGSRDAGQVLANGGFATFCVVAYTFFPSPLWWVAYVGAMATVTADTWATEIGAFSKRSPRSVVTGKLVPKGTSGGVSSLGLLASATGALVIAVLAGTWNLNDELHIKPFMILLVGTFGGFIGAWVDSFLGATVQSLYRCQECRKVTESKFHCQSDSQKIKGWSGVHNDTVNLVSSMAGSGAAVLMYLLLR